MKHRTPGSEEPGVLLFLGRARVRRRTAQAGAPFTNIGTGRAGRPIVTEPSRPRG